MSHLNSLLKTHEGDAPDHDLIDQQPQGQPHVHSEPVNQQCPTTQVQNFRSPLSPQQTAIDKKHIQLEEYAVPVNMQSPVLQYQAIHTQRLLQPEMNQHSRTYTNDPGVKQLPHLFLSAVNHEVTQNFRMQQRTKDHCVSSKLILQEQLQKLNQQRKVNQYYTMQQQRSTDYDGPHESTLQLQRQQVNQHWNVLHTSAMQKQKLHRQGARYESRVNKTEAQQQELVNHQFENYPVSTMQQQRIGDSSAHLVSPFDKADPQHEQHFSVSYSCDICCKIFQSESDLVYHKAVHKKGKAFYCDECRDPFPNKSKIQNHYLSQHFEYKPFVCLMCFKGFRKVNEMISHKDTHTGEDRVNCHVCEKAFYRRCDFEQHNLSHVGDKRYGCKFCTKRFYLKCYCRIHEQSHRFLKPYICKICYLGFSRKISLKKHEVKHHPGERETTCYTCKEIFETEIELYDHSYVHPLATRNAQGESSKSVENPEFNLHEVGPDPETDVEDDFEIDVEDDSETEIDVVN